MNRVHDAKKVVLIILLATVAWILSCAVNPVTGKRELMLVSKQEEIAMGKSADPQIVQTYGIYDDPGIQQFVSDLGQQMARISHRPDLPYEFKVMDSPVINAFAVPGGYVYITRGILAYLNNEAEFAGVLGHEIGHITARHSAQQVSQQQLAQVGFGAGVITAQALGASDALLSTIAQAAQAGLGLLFLKFGRDDERQSDQLGVEYSTAIGYDAREMANFFETLERMHPSEGSLPGWFSTHPTSAERIENVRQLAAEAQRNLDRSQLKVNRDSYLRLIDGIVYGEDPRQGYVEENIFYHPQLKFQFPIPAGWKYQNTPSVVQMASEDGKAAMNFTLASGNTPQAAAQDFVSKSKASVVSSQALTVNGFSTQKVVSQINVQDGVLGVLSYFIQDGSNIYAFHGFTAAGNFTGYQPVLEASMKNFRRLSDQRKINVQPDRVRVKPVTRDGDLRSGLKSLDMPDDKLEELGILNGMQLDNPVQKNMLIKVISK